MQNAGLQNNVKINKKIIVEAIKIASFLNDERPQKDKTVLVNKFIFGSEGKDRAKMHYFIGWGRIMFVASKRVTPKKN